MYLFHILDDEFITFKLPLLQNWDPELHRIYSHWGMGVEFLHASHEGIQP